MGVAPSIIEWNTPSYFLINLVGKRGGICEETDSPNPLYMGLRELVCGEDLSVLEYVDSWEPIGKPYYPFILIGYYLLFHRLDFDTALMVYEWLRSLLYGRVVREAGAYLDESLVMLNDWLERFQRGELMRLSVLSLVDKARIVRDRVRELYKLYVPPFKPQLFQVPSDVINSLEKELKSRSSTIRGHL